AGMPKISRGKDRRFEPFEKKFHALGARETKVIDPATVVTAPWVRWKCRFGCGGYNSSLMCPPHSPTPEETRNVLDSYRRAILFEAGRGDTKKIAAEMEREIFLSGYHKAFGLGAGPCRLCSSCAFDEGCRNPDKARPALEACGIDVFTTVRKHGFRIDVVKDYKDPQRFFGIVLID
ncbi:MAG TPA: DUF2284 domain-containing protein, partial [Thermodesulfobacteriota bacterium]|nr:DUF2284 domain-containing protein [Thermodesulfobacteriota bacterium]